ncbi:AraC family transcriptional regulator [Enterococcus sp. AZ196]|uniref:AraC family transcriptional regulator n=1 Tax=Enterococcus sp. AZ196 TaxID=2774659 RepID=UPI003D2DED9B
MTFWENANHSWTSDSTRFILTPKQRTRELFYFVQEIGYFKAHQPYFTERENLPSYLMKFTLSGAGELHYQDAVYSLKAGDIFLIDCKKYQYYKTTSKEPWEMDWIHFSGGNSDSFYQEFIKNGSPVFHTDSENVRTNQVHLIVDKLLQLQKEPNAKTDFESSILVHELLNELILQKYQMDFSDSEIPVYLYAVKNYIDENFRRGVTLEEMEGQFHINKYQIVKDFSKYMGQPPVDYQISCKISYAKDLLRYSNLSIKEVSMEIGIDNFAYFSRLFKKKTGVSPSDYRSTDTILR